MEAIVEIGGWEHECCGPAFERDEVVELSCFAVSHGSDGVPHYAETHHDLARAQGSVMVRGRVVDIAIRHEDGSLESLVRLPSGEALRGFDEHDDGHLTSLETGEPVSEDTDSFLLTIAG